jgi:hypothetical protein
MVRYASRSSVVVGHPSRMRTMSCGAEDRVSIVVVFRRVELSRLSVQKLFKLRVRTPDTRGNGADMQDCRARLRAEIVAGEDL